MRIEGTKLFVITALLCCLTAKAFSSEIFSGKKDCQKQESVISKAARNEGSIRESFENVSKIIMKRSSYPHGWNNISFVNNDCSYQGNVTMLVSAGSFWYSDYKKTDGSVSERGLNETDRIRANLFYANEMVSRCACPNMKALCIEKRDGNIFDSSSISWDFRRLDDFKFSDYPDVKSDSKKYWSKQNIQNDMNVKRNRGIKTDTKLIENININQKKNESQPATFENEEKFIKHDEIEKMMSGFTCGYTLEQSIFIVLSIIGFGLVQNKQ